MMHYKFHCFAGRLKGFVELYQYQGGTAMDRKLRMGMVGGGTGAFIGGVHRMAAMLDGRIELVCGAFSSTPEKSRKSGRELFLPEERIYGDYKEMFKTEKELSPSERMDFVSIVTPNSTHYPVAKAAMESGFDVVCDKPLALTLAEAKMLRKKVGVSGALFCLTHNYTGYPMVKQAKEIVKKGEIGKIRRVVVEYPQGWMASPLESEGMKQALWRTDPKLAGSSFTMGDIGTHCANLLEYITGLHIEKVYARLNTFVRGRKLDDDGSVLLDLGGGAHGLLWASGIAVGEENGLNIRVYGEKGSLRWRQEEPNTLEVRWTDKPGHVIRTGTPSALKAANDSTRLPAGHPEGFIEAFANLYKNFADALLKKLSGKKADSGAFDFPGIEEGVRGMAFIEGVVKSSKTNKWVKV